MLSSLMLAAASAGRRRILEQDHQERSHMRHLQSKGDAIETVVLDHPEYQHGSCAPTPVLPREIRGHGFKQ